MRILNILLLLALINDYRVRNYKINSRPLKSTHLRDIARKQCPADFFNK